MFGVVRRHHRVFGAKPPSPAILLRGHVVCRFQVPLQHLQPLAVLEADDVVMEYRFPDRDGGLRPFRLDRFLAHAGQGLIDSLDQQRQCIRRHRIARYMRRDDLRRQFENIGVGVFTGISGPLLAKDLAIIGRRKPFRNRYLSGQERDNNMKEKQAPDQELDITAEVCPMTFVRTRLALDRMAPGQILRVRLRGEEPLRNVPRTAREQGHEVLSLDTGADGVATLLLRRGDSVGCPMGSQRSTHPAQRVIRCETLDTAAVTIVKDRLAAPARPTNRRSIGGGGPPRRSPRAGRAPMRRCCRRPPRGTWRGRRTR